MMTTPSVLMPLSRRLKSTVLLARVDHLPRLAPATITRRALTQSRQILGGQHHKKYLSDDVDYSGVIEAFKPFPIRELETSIPCNFPGCGARLWSLSALAAHMGKHSGLTLYVCEWPGCYKDFRDRTELESHRHSHSDHRPYECDHPGCYKTYRTPSHLNRHKLKHADEKPHKCGFVGCDRSFADATDAAKHRRTHTGERPYKCTHPGCDSAFAQSSTLKRHMRTHPVRFVCEWPGCDQEFALRSHRTAHQREHQGEKRYHCRFAGCDVSYTFEHHRNQHEQRHRNEWPEYEEKFAVPTRLTRQQRMLLGTQTYICRFGGCGASYSNTKNRNRHEQSHRSEWPEYEEKFAPKPRRSSRQKPLLGTETYACRYAGCETSYSSDANRLRHERMYHKSSPKES